jgi:hypothetical protein
MSLLPPAIIYRYTRAQIMNGRILYYRTPSAVFPSEELVYPYDKVHVFMVMSIEICT